MTNNDPTYRDAHADGLIDISFYDNWDKEVTLHAIAIRATNTITRGSAITHCGLTVTPRYNEWRTPEEAEHLLASVSGCAACLEAVRARLP